MATVLAINGSTINRPANRLVINRFSRSMDGPSTLEWTEKGVSLPGSWGHGDLVTLTVDGTTVFSGQCTGSYPSGMNRGPIDVGYRALSLEWLVNRIAITASDGTGTLVYNLPSTDDDYIAANSGLSVGTILQKLFDLHATQLTAAGLSAAPSYTAADLTPLTVVPPEPVIIQGRVWNAVIELLSTWHNKYGCWIDPSTQKIVIRNLLTLPTTTLTLDSDPVTLDAISRDHSECYTQVILRGGANIEGAFLKKSDGSLPEGFSSGDKAAWNINSGFYQPASAADSGTINSMTSTTVTVQSSNTALTWATNYWSGINAELWAINPAGTGIAFNEQRRITACTSLTAGGTATITVDVPFVNAGYTKYEIRGLSASSSLTWRKYTIPNSYISQHLCRRLHHSTPWEPTDGVTVQTLTPTAVICWSASGSPPYNEFPATFQIVPYDGVTNGYIIFDEPTVKAFGTLSKLQIGGATTDGIPSDIKVLVPYSRGAISVTKPAASYEGTAYTVDNVQRTLYRDYPQWLDARDTTSYQTLAQEILDTVKNTVVEGSLTYWDKLSSVLTLGKALNIADATYTTGFEAIAASIREVTLDYQEPAQIWVTRLRFSNRMKPFSGDRLYAHPAFGSQANQWGGWLSRAESLAPGLQAADQAALSTANVAHETWGNGPDGPIFASDGRTGRNKPLDWASPEAIQRRREAHHRERVARRHDRAIGFHAADFQDDGSTAESRALEAQRRAEQKAGTGDLPGDVFASTD
jgi:hypothetical protein